ncbi:ribosomal-processing cysteine protease Prp [Clostridium sp. HCP1S3_B4]|uniref:ribosomal-processing cysteine protease Prp n=1 Tax=unclassified Clostridium TaxID=2614128 RepID=UPI0016BC0555|nr:ribosomal-processing cysteine protease Prp [Clostridiales bacterium]MDY2730087.1 ribosomal-processing cysteine protease Prp [Clostridium sp.]NLK22841.1 ribosomal-processing cysteine protease Prp [Clostridiales bacterium]
MIKVIIKLKDQNITSISINNHALEDREAILAGDAYDMVCNSVSVLGQSVIIGLDEVLKLNVNYEIGEGHLKVDLEGLNVDEKEKAQVILKTFEKSLESVILSLNQMFGDKKRREYINLKKEEV